MKNSVSIKIPNSLQYYPIVHHALLELTKAFTQEDVKKLDIALKELISNSIQHAYKDRDGLIQIEYHLFLHGIRIDVIDRGIPMASHTIDKEENRGLGKVSRLMDRFKYENLGTEGKKFTIVKYSSQSIVHEVKSVEETSISQKGHQEHLKIRPFQAGDESGISRLIYENYGLSYVKDMFYYPSKILEHHGAKFYSIVVENHQEIVGHFAFVLLEDSNIAEVGIAVVSPKFQGRGLMNKMFDQLLVQAKRLRLHALYGEAIMYHTYSQKSNLKHNFYETALEIGKLVNTVKLKGNALAEMEKRGSVLIGYKLLQPVEKELFIPKIYKDKIVEIYQNCADIQYWLPTKKIESKHSKIHYTFEPHHNIATIIIDEYNQSDFYHLFHHILDHLRAKHCDMIYADINMEQISEIDELVERLNHSLFFFSGVLLLKHQEQDYLHMQYKHSEHIGQKNIVCYSEFCKSLLVYILEDEQRVRELNGYSPTLCENS
ncbi:MAG: GNAT family N-acetyltransferase [Epsilonproteobacteria bacterium]|nr:GNAT family N-acetyltransferase [Campylobacterota bacterium]